MLWLYTVGTVLWFKCYLLKDLPLTYRQVSDLHSPEREDEHNSRENTELPHYMCTFALYVCMYISL